MSLTLSGPPVRTAAPAPPFPATPPSGRRRPSLDTWIRIGLVVAAVTVQAVNIAGFPALGDDEGTYLAQAWAVQEGLGLAHYTYWYDHPPVGWLQLAALSWIPALLLPEHLAVGNGRVVMLVFTAVSVALLYTLARRLTLPRWAAALAGLLFTLSPLAVTLQRQIYLDNIAVSWMLAAMVLAVSPRRYLWHHAAAGFCAAVAVLSKETMLIALPALLVLLWQGTHPATRKFSLVGFAALFGLTGVLYPLFALLRTELLPGADHVSLVDGIAFQLTRPGSGTFLDADSGARLIVESWLYYDAILVVAGLACAVGALAIRTMRGPALAVLLFAVMAMRPGYLPGMYVVQALPFLALCIAGVAAAVVGFVLTYRARPDTTGRLLRGGAVAVLAAGAIALVVPPWVAGDRTAMTADLNDNVHAAVAHLAAMPDPQGTNVIVDDAIWLDLVRAGYRPGDGAVWFYKLDLDPAVTIPGGVHYVVSTPIIRASTTGLPRVVRALENSVPVATFGAGGDRVEIRRVLEP
ncbi:MAG: ArnT family glycosyltransferase [Pseudonocardia sp.]